MYSGAEDAVVRELVWANKILTNEGTIDAYGHVSVRSPERPDVFFISRAISPRLVQYDDIYPFTLDCEPVTDMGDHRPYIEMVLHAAIYQARPDVQVVIHNHPQPLVTMAAAGLPVRPIIHSAKMFCDGVPVFHSYDVSNAMLIRTMSEAKRLARVLGDKRAVLMQNHGAVVVGEDLPRTVASSIFLVRNAEMQIQAHLLSGLLGTTPHYIDADAAHEMMQSHNQTGEERSWTFWQSRVPADWFSPGFLQDR